MTYQMPDRLSKAEYVKNNFNVIARKYDIFNDLNSFFMHRLWKNKMAEIVEEFAREKGQITCLDLCCGTGDISQRLVAISKTAKVYSVDFSAEMLAIAKERLKDSAKSEIFTGDATNLKQFKNKSLDVVTIGFGLRNVNDLEKTLQEIFRVLKPGGIFINLDVGKVKIPLIKQLANFYFFKIVPIMGYLLWGGKNEMFDYLPASSVAYPDQEKLALILRKTGFSDVKWKNFVFGNVAMHFAKIIS